MNFAKSILMRAFGRPRGMLGRLGGMIMARTNRRIAERAIELLDAQPNDSVLEVGFGPGVGIELLARSASSGLVAGIDPSTEMVDQATARNAEGIRTGRVVLKQGVAESVPFKDARFDKALAINSMQIWPDAGAGLREIRRVLKPGGKLVLGFTPYSGQRKEGLLELLAEAGFAGVHVKDVNEDFCVVAVKP
ncbi:class I SAM-dependent methyltransferase [Candidatus Nitrospira bockiana]